MMKKHLFTILFFVPYLLVAQDTLSYTNTQMVLRINFLNPAIELELPTGKNSTISGGLGIGIGGGYPHISQRAGLLPSSGYMFMVNPFLDVQQKWFYNFERRKRKNKTIANNSGDFASMRFLTRGYSLLGNIARTSDFDFAIGPTWGIQRKINDNFHLLFDIGTLVYFDTKGYYNFFPIMLQINLGFDL